MRKHLCFHLFFFVLFLSMSYKLDYALKTQKWRAVCNCLAIYGGPFHTWWNTNYIAYVQKSKAEKTQASQTWPKQSDTTLHSIPKLVWRIKSSNRWVRSNPAASNPRCLATSLSLLYECQSWISSLSKVELKVKLCLSISSKACKVPTMCARECLWSHHLVFAMA